MLYNISTKGTAISGYSHVLVLLRNTATCGRRAVFLNFYVKIKSVLLLRENLVTQRDNRCEHRDEQNQFGKCHHSYHLPYGSNRLPLCTVPLAVLRLHTIYIIFRRFCQILRPFIPHPKSRRSPGNSPQAFCFRFRKSRALSREY